MAYGTINADQIGTSVANTSLGAGDASLLKNRIINGAMVIDQRNAGARVTATTSNLYTIDRWQAFATQSSKYTVQQNAGSVTPPAGFTNYLGVTSLAATSVGASDFYLISQGIEGYNFADLSWGTANAKTITISFWVRSSLTGTFGSSLTNGGNRSYPFTYTISSANTWEQKSVTIAGDTTGTWNTTNTAAAFLFFSLGAGSTWSATAGSWQAGNYLSSTGATSVVGTNGATFYITGVQLEVGSSVTGFEYVNYQTSLANCQRYYQKTGFGMCGRAEATTLATLSGKYIVEMRSAPTATLLSGTTALATFGVSAYDVSSLATTSNSTNDFRQAFNSSGMTTGNIINGYAANFLGWSAEL
jgi:hypothetical protein